LKVQEAQRLSPDDPSAWGLILILAQAHMNMKEFANAEKYARQAKRVADNLPINIVLLAILGQSGKTVDAKRLVEEMLQDHPHITAQLISKIYPFRHQDDLDIWIEGLCKAGLPEA